LYEEIILSPFRNILFISLFYRFLSNYQHNIQNSKLAGPWKVPLIQYFNRIDIIIYVIWNFGLWFSFSKKKARKRILRQLRPSHPHIYAFVHLFTVSHTKSKKKKKLIIKLASSLDLSSALKCYRRNIKWLCQLGQKRRLLS
jgi:hypothetical protein